MAAARCEIPAIPRLSCGADEQPIWTIILVLIKFKMLVQLDLNLEGDDTLLYFLSRTSAVPRKQGILAVPISALLSRGSILYFFLLCRRRRPNAND